MVTTLDALRRQENVELMARQLYMEIVVCEGPPADQANGRYLAECCFDVAEWFEAVAEAERSVAATTQK